MPSPLDIVAVSSRSSLGFLRAVFRLYDEGRAFAIARDDVDLAAQPGLNVTETIEVDAQTGWGRFAHAPKADDAPAQIVFTSGTEGRPKAIALSAGNLADVVARLNNAMRVTAEIREYIGVPVTYSFGLARARAVAAAGGEFFLPERFDPHEIRAMLEAGEINAISAVPSLWRVVLMQPDVIGEAGRRVRWIEIGSQYMSRAEKEGMKALFPNARILQHYGLTEASRSTFLDITATTGEALESVGAPFGAVEIRIAPDHAVEIRGPHVALGRLDESGAIVPLTDAEGWLKTSDRGRWHDGLLWYGGRMDDQINLGGVKFAAEALERDVSELTGVAGAFAIAGIPDPLRGEAVLLAYEPEMAERAEILAAALRAVLRRKGLEPGGAMRVMPVARLPRTETNKIRRRDLRAAWAAQGDAAPAPAPDAAAALTPEQARIAVLWSKSLAGAAPDPGSSFHDLGGDSLSGLQVALSMEAAGFSQAQVRATLEGRTLAEVAAAEDGAAAAVDALPPRTVFSWSINALRGIMVLVVLLGHWGPGVFFRFGELGREIGLGLVPLYRLGTPGFAAVFGLGLGFFMLPHWRARRRSLTLRLFALAGLVGVGMLVISGARLSALAVEGVVIDAGQVTVSLYNVLLYYAMALVTAPLWLSALAALRARSAALVAPTALFAAVACWIVAGAFEAGLGHVEIGGPMQILQLIFTAKYGYFHMSSIVFAGLGFGVWLSERRDPIGTGRALVLGAGAAFAAFVTAILENHPNLTEIGPFDPVLWGMQFTMAYLALTVLIAGVLLLLISAWATVGSITRVMIRFTIVMGVLSLPFFAFHSAVIPVKNTLSALGLPGIVALGLPLGLFVLAACWGCWRVHAAYFAAGRTGKDAQ